MGNNSSTSLMPFLTLIEFLILGVLLKGKHHGFGIIQAIAEQTGDTLILSAGTLYAALKRMYKEGLIADTTLEDPDPKGHFERRRYYKITSRGIQAISTDAHRLDVIVKNARVSLLELPQLELNLPTDANTPARTCVAFGLGLKELINESS